MEHLLRRQLPLMFVGVSRAVRLACPTTLSERMIPPVAAIMNGAVLDYVEVKRNTVPTREPALPPEDDELPF